jgi:hypothetical protein
MQRQLIATVGSFLAAACPAAQAAVVFQEDFSGATPGTYSGAIPGTKFTVTSDNVDVVGVLNGSFFSCVANPAGNCWDLIGNEGGGQIQSTTIGLIKGETYTISYTSILQGFPTGSSTPSESYDVNLGDETFQETVIPTVTPVTISFKADANQPNAYLEFTDVTAVDSVHGPVLSDITVVASSVPEPSTWSMFLLGFVGVGVAGYRAARKSLESAT